MKRFFVSTFNKYAGTLEQFEKATLVDIFSSGGLEALSVSENPNTKDLVFHITCGSDKSDKHLKLFGIADMSLVENDMWNYVSKLKNGTVEMAQLFFLSGNRAVGVVVVQKEKTDVRTKRTKKESTKGKSDQDVNAGADSGTSSGSVD